MTYTYTCIDVSVGSRMDPLLSVCIPHDKEVDMLSFVFISYLIERIRLDDDGSSASLFCILYSDISSRENCTKMYYLMCSLFGYAIRDLPENLHKKRTSSVIKAISQISTPCLDVGSLNLKSLTLNSLSSQIQKQYGRMQRIT